MPIEIYPKPGQILMCDFSKGFKEPEMTKNRPVVVLTPPMNGRNNLTTIVALSTVKPDPVLKFHCHLPKASLPMTGFFQGSETWVKGDMVYSVGFHRLDLVRLGTRNPDGSRCYFKQRLSRAKMREIYSCLLHGLNLGAMAEHIPE